MEKVNRLEAAKARIEKCASEMGFELSDSELTTFAIIQVGLVDDARELAKQKLSGQATPAAASYQATDADLPKNLWPAEPTKELVVKSREVTQGTKGGKCT